jgi:hypothetical protein
LELLGMGGEKIRETRTGGAEIGENALAVAVILHPIVDAADEFCRGVIEDGTGLSEGFELCGYAIAGWNRGVADAEHISSDIGRIGRQHIGSGLYFAGVTRLQAVDQGAAKQYR